MTGIGAIHDALGEVHSSASDIRAVIYIRDGIDGSAVDSHAQLDPLVGSQRSDTLSAHCTGASGLLKKTSAIPSPVGMRISCPALSADWKCGVSRTARFNSAMTSICSIGQQLRVADHINEKNMRNLQLGFRLEIISHFVSRAGNHVNEPSHLYLHGRGEHPVSMAGHDPEEWRPPPIVG